MRKHLFLSLAVTALLLVAASPASAQSKTGIVDLKKVFEGYWKTKQADVNLKERAAELDKRMKEMVDDGRKAEDEYTKLLDSAKDQTVSNEEREKRKKAAEGKLLELKEIQQSVQQFDRQARAQLADQQRRMRDNVIREIQEAVNARAKAGGFSLVFDSASETVNNTPVILYNDGSNDLTDEVLKQLNTTAPADLPKKADDATPKK